MHILWNLPPADLSLRSADSEDVVPLAWSSVTDIHHSSYPLPEALKHPEEFDRKNELKQLKKEVS